MAVDPATSAALSLLEEARARFEEAEAMARALGNNAGAGEFHRFYVWTHRAYKVERDNRPPKPRRVDKCNACPLGECDRCLMCRKATA